MIADFNSENAVLILYRGGAYGNFLYHVLGKHVSNTVKIDNKDFYFSSSGDSHSTFKYINPYYLAGELGKNIKSYSDYKYVPTVVNESAWSQMQSGKKFLVLCDTSTIDNYAYLLSLWPQGVMIRTHMPTFMDRLVGYANLMHKAGNIPTTGYKNCLFDANTVAQFKQQGSNLDQTIEDATVKLFQQNFNWYGKTFVKEAVSSRIYNVKLSNLAQWDAFEKTMQGIADFLHGHLIDTDGLKNLYHNFHKNQTNFMYYNYTKHTVPDPNDLIGKPLIKFLQT
jgi:hypothetical protein